MFQFLLGAGLMAVPLYKLYRNTRGSTSGTQPPLSTQASSQDIPTPFINFAPKLVIVTKIAVPVRSNNNARELAQEGASTETVKQIENSSLNSLPKVTEKNEKTGSNGKLDLSKGIVLDSQQH